MISKTNKSKFNIWGADNPEKLKETSRTPSVTKQLTDIVNPVKLLDQIFATNNQETKTPENSNRIKGNETILFSHVARKEDREVAHKTAQILSELKKQVTILEKSEKALVSEIAKVKVADIPKETGIYYLRYFEWLIGLVRGMRVKIDQGRAWLSAFNARSKKKQGYWGKYKKHGTTFGLSQERILSTQTG